MSFESKNQLIAEIQSASSKLKQKYIVYNCSQKIINFDERFEKFGASDLLQMSIHLHRVSTILTNNFARSRSPVHYNHKQCMSVLFQLLMWINSPRTEIESLYYFVGRFDQILSFQKEFDRFSLPSLPPVNMRRFQMKICSHL